MQTLGVFTQRPKAARHWTAAALAAAGLMALCGPAGAQVAPGTIPPGHERVGPAMPGQSDFDFSIVAPHRSPVPRAVDEVHFQLSDIKISGAVSIPAAQFRPLYQPLIGKDVTLGDILKVAEEIEARYRAAGYLLVRAFVPPQRVADGVFTINVVEGYVANVTVQGSDEATRNLVRQYLAPVQDARPLRLSMMERGLLMANDLPGVSATGVLRPAPDTRGASDLVVDTLQPWISGGASINNRGSPFSGVWTAVGDVELNSIFGADQLAGTVTISPSSIDQVSAELLYRRAIGGDGLVGTVVGTWSHGQPGSTLTAFNVLTDSWTVGPRLTYPLIRTRAETLLLDGGITVQDARVAVIGLPFSHDQWRVLDVGGSYQRAHVLGGVWTITLDIAQGLPILGATPNGSLQLSRLGGATDFTKFDSYSRLALPVFDSLTFVLSAQGQYSFGRLISGEQISFGGTGIGRGYDPGALTGDWGAGGSAEFRYDVHLNNAYVRSLQPYVFVDAARTWYIRRGIIGFPPLADLSIASVGGGVRAWLPYNVMASVEVAQTLEAVTSSDNGKRATKVLVDLSVRL